MEQLAGWQLRSGWVGSIPTTPCPQLGGKVAKGRVERTHLGSKTGSCELLLTGKAQHQMVKSGWIRGARDVKRSNEGKPPPVHPNGSRT